jgi:hypothetical protein
MKKILLHYNRMISNDSKESNDETTSILPSNTLKSNTNTTNDNNTDQAQYNLTTNNMIINDSDGISIDSDYLNQNSMDAKYKIWLRKRNILILLGACIILIILIVAIFIWEPWKKK